MVKFHNIISFLPSATEILFELDLGDYLKGVTHECTYPKQALNKPKIISPSINFNNLDSFEIDEKVKNMTLRNEPMFILNSGKIIEIKPDLIFSQNLCSVCAPFDKEIKETYRILGYEPKNIVLNPKTLNQIVESIDLIGREVGNHDKAKSLCHNLETRINKIIFHFKESLNNKRIKRRLRILCLDWINPFYLAGHWVPDMVNIAGGENLIGYSGSSSRSISIEEISMCNPDKIILMPCGFDIDRSLSDYTFLKENEVWNSLKTVKDREVYLVDSKSYFSKPSPRIVNGIEILCKILYPDIFEKIQIPKSSFIRL